MRSHPNVFKTSTLVGICLAAPLASARAMPAASGVMPGTGLHDSALSADALATTLKVGDIVFIRVTAKPFREVASTTGSWTNHVGIVINADGAQPLIAESTFPLSRNTTLSRFVARSEDGRVAVARLKAGMSEDQQKRVRAAATKRSGIFYDTGFNLHSNRQFCSRFVREVVTEATGTAIGEVETFATLLARRPETDLGFWKIWYFGHIPWQRETVTPASLLSSPELQLVYDGTSSSRRSAQPLSRN